MAWCGGTAYSNDYKCYIDDALRGILGSVGLYSTGFNIGFFIVEIILIATVIVCTFCAGNDFTKHFIGITSIPIILDVLSQGLLLFTDYQTREFHEVLQSFSIMALVLGSIKFLGQNMHMVHNRKHLATGTQCIPFILILVFSGIYNWIFFHNISTDRYFDRQTSFAIFNYYFLLGLHICLVLMILIALCTLCCGTNSVKDQNRQDPVIVNAKLRLCWAIPFVICVTVPYWSSFVFALIFRNYRTYYNYMVAYSTVSVLGPLIYFASALLLLPTYRSALFCCCENRRKQQKAVASAPNVKIQPPPATVAPTAPTPIPRPPQPFLYPVPHGAYPEPQQMPGTQQFTQYQLGLHQAQLTGQVQSLPQVQMQPQHAPGQVCASCTVPMQGGYGGYMMPQQSNMSTMTRHASQPNLTVITPAPVILRHSNSATNIAAQNPYYVGP